MILNYGGSEIETIIIKLDSAKMETPDLDILYLLPERIEEFTHNKIMDNGYDCITNNELGIWLATKEAEKSVDLVIELIRTETILDNDLSKSVEIYILEKESAEISDGRKVFPA